MALKTFAALLALYYKCWNYGIIANKTILVFLVHMDGVYKGLVVHLSPLNLC